MAQRIIPCNNCGSKKHKLLVKVKGNRGADFIAKTHNVVICENCGLVFLNPQHEEIDYDRYYTNLYYPKDFASKNNIDISEIGDITHPYLKDFLLKNIDFSLFSPRAKLLDIGCGYSSFLYLFKDEKNIEISGLEPNKEVANFAREKLGLKIYECTINNHNLPLQSFDVITALAVIEHVTDPLATLKKMRELLRPNGYIFITTPDYKNAALRKGVGKFFKFVHTFYYTDITLSSLVRQAGFEVLKIWSIPPDLRQSTIFHPSRYKEGMLHLFAKKNKNIEKTSFLKDDVNELIDLYKKIRKRDYPYCIVSYIAPFYSSCKSFWRKFFRFRF